MPTEIKEILDKLNNKAEHYILYDYEVKQLLDYITNLQTIEQQYSAILSENAELENKITNLQEKLKSANESITWWQNRFKAVERDKEIKKLKATIKKLENNDISK